MMIFVSALLRVGEQLRRRSTEAVDVRDHAGGLVDLADRFLPLGVEDVAVGDH